MRRLTWFLLALALGGCADGVTVDLAEENNRGVQVDASVVLTDSGSPQPDSGANEEGQRDSGVDADEPVPVPVGPPRFDARVVSGIDEAVASMMRSTASRASRNGNVFAKIGDSNTVNTNYMACFAGSQVDLGGLPLDGAWQHFRAGNAAGKTPFERVTLAAVVGWSASSAIAGSPSPIEQEIAAISPRFATVQFGTNDIQSMNIARYGENLLDIADVLVGSGVIPIFTAIPARGDSSTANAWVPRYNAVARGVAQTRGGMFVDVHQEYSNIPNQGLISDGLHLNSLGAGKACVFTEAGLQYGMNVRNRYVLEALGKAQAALSGDAPDATLPVVPGAGTLEDPIEIEAFPFADARNTTSAAQSRFDSYPGCDAGQNESGGEFIYRLVLDAPANLHIMLFDRGTVDIDLHLLDASGEPAGCIDRDDDSIDAQLQAGTYYLALDTYVGSTPRPGEYLLVVTQD